jgi:uncharacterized membrane protein
VSPRGASSTGLDANVAAVLAYAFGAISGVVFLIIERKSAYVRFHAMQSTLTFLAVTVLLLALGSFPVVGWLLAGGVYLVGLVLWAVLMFKAFTGERYRLPYLGEIAARQLG